VIVPDTQPAVRVNGMRVAGRYISADRDVQVGGDWYVAAPLPDGGLLLAVGDVGGHGLVAATAMVQLRAATTAFALAGYPPERILAALNDLLCRQSARQRRAVDASTAATAVATAVVARYRPDTHRLTWARAGHPPMLLAGPAGVDVLYEPGGMMLGVRAGTDYHATTVDMHTADLLLMYTDGFAESPVLGVDEGVRVLIERLARAREQPRRDRLIALVNGLDQSNPNDDACVLAAEPVR
jgi:serine phosphatase RsbU (regulator of sigma subunit)